MRAGAQRKRPPQALLKFWGFGAPGALRYCPLRGRFPWTPALHSGCAVAWPGNDGFVIAGPGNGTGCAVASLRP
jgi:hypothetical protein